MREYMIEDIQSFCLEIFKNPPQFKECNVGNQNHINKRGELGVKLFEKLIDRDYLV